MAHDKTKWTVSKSTHNTSLPRIFKLYGKDTHTQNEPQITGKYVIVHAWWSTEKKCHSQSSEKFV